MSEQLFWLSALPHRKELSGFSDITLENKTMLCPDLSYKRIVDIVDYLDSKSGKLLKEDHKSLSYRSHIVYPFNCWWTPGLLLPFGCWEQCSRWMWAYKHLFEILLSILCMYPRSGIAESQNSVRHFFRNHHPVFHSVCTTLPLHQRYTRGPISLHLHLSFMFGFHISHSLSSHETEF